jgi:flagellar biosynthesis protein FliP
MIGRLRSMLAPRRQLLLLALPLLLAGCGSQSTPDLSVTIGSGEAASGGGQFSLGIQLLIVMTVLSMVPAVLLLMTSFTRIVVVLSLLRHAIGIPTLPPNQVMLGLAFFLTLFVMAPTFKELNEEALQPYFEGVIGEQAAFDEASAAFRGFMLRHVGEQDLATFLDLSGAARPENVDDIPTEVLLPAFVVSELRTAFTIGFLLFIPFLVIELIVASMLMSMGMVMVPPTQISLPFKLLLFVLVDGWALIAESLVRSFH